MDTIRGERGWWWLDARRRWCWTRLRLVAVMRARRARRAEMQVRLDGWGR